jgi:hypothetical protein
MIHCPRCGDRLTFGAPETGPVQVREDIREPILPLPPFNPYYPLVLLAAAGLVIAGGLVAGMIYFTRNPRVLPDAAREGIRATPREPEPVLAIREIPVLPPSTTPAEAAKPSLLVPEVPVDLSEPLAKAQKLSVRANVAGIVLTILTLTGKADESRELALELARIDQEIRALLAPVGDRPEARSVDYFKPGDELAGLGAVARDPLRPALFAEALRGWLSEVQNGAFAVATIQRAGRTFTQSMWFPEFPADLTRRVLGPAGKSPK